MRRRGLAIGVLLWSFVLAAVAWLLIAGDAWTDGLLVLVASACLGVSGVMIDRRADREWVEWFAGVGVLLSVGVSAYAALGDAGGAVALIACLGTLAIVARRRSELG